MSEIVAGIPKPDPIPEERVDEALPESYHVGLDLGKLSDYTALAVIERWPTPKEEPGEADEARRRPGLRQHPPLHLRHLE